MLPSVDQSLLLSERDRLTDALHDAPYDLFSYICRAGVYAQLGFHDLVAGDSYRALLLADEVTDDSGEYHEEAKRTLSGHLRHGSQRDHKEVEACDQRRRTTAVEERGADLDDKDGDGQHDAELMLYLLQHQHINYRLLVTALIKSNCFRSALEYHDRALSIDPLPTSAAPSHPYPVLEIEASLLTLADAVLDHRPTTLARIDRAALSPDRGTSRRTIYPWNTHEPDRFAPSTLAFLNAELEKVAPKCEVRVTELPILHSNLTASDHSTPTPTTVRQLGVFARSEIHPGEVFLEERSVLTANNRLHAPLCDCCSSNLPAPTSPSQEDFIIPCLSCDDIVYCSQSCHDLAQQTYHPSVCGTSVETIGKDVISARDTSEALYLLLLARALAMAFTQQIHPLDLQETRYLWGDFSVSAQLPFSFVDSVERPLHVLEKMEIDIYRHLDETDTWVLQTLAAKFRNTASARMSAVDRRVEVAAVHWRWSLANHSCVPGAQWEWGGTMVYTARANGIAKGEEVLNHYCDVGLPVKERREWMMGTLGGLCMCSRCVREAADEEVLAKGLLPTLPSEKTLEIHQVEQRLQELHLPATDDEAQA